MSRRFLATTSLSAAALLVAAGAATPALAAEETATETSAVVESATTEASASASTAHNIKPIQVEFGILDIVQDGYFASSLTGHFYNIEKNQLNGLKVVTTFEDTRTYSTADKDQFTSTLKVGQQAHSFVDGSENDVFKKYPLVTVAGFWASSNEEVFTVDQATGRITAVGAGTADVTFIPAVYDLETQMASASEEISFSVPLTVVADETKEEENKDVAPAPAPEETAAPEVAPAPAPEETAVPEETVAPAPSETPAPEAAPEETAAPEAAPAPEETVAPAEPVVEEAPVAVVPATETFAYENCDAVKVALGRSISSDEPGYAPHLDSDSDGVGCEANDNYTGTYYDANNTVYASGTGDYYNGNYTGTYYSNNSGHSELAATGLSNGQLAATGLGLLVAGAATVTYRGRHFAR